MILHLRRIQSGKILHSVTFSDDLSPDEQRQIARDALLSAYDYDDKNLWPKDHLVGTGENPEEAIFIRSNGEEILKFGLLDLIKEMGLNLVGRKIQ
jgi:hypothetical protein